MKPVSYKNSIRVKKARAARIFKKPVTTSVLVLSVLLIAAGVVLFYLSYATRPLSALAGIGIAGVMFALWAKWDLSVLDAVYNPDSAEIALNDVVSADIVYLIDDRQSPQQILQSIVGNWQTQFILMRYQIPAEVLFSSLPADSESAKMLWNKAYMMLAQLPVKEISGGVLVVAMINDNSLIQDWLRKNSLDENDISGGLMWLESLWRHMIRPKDQSS